MPSSRVTAAMRLLVIPAIVAVAVFAAWRLGYFELDRRQALVETVQRLRVVPHIELAFVVVYAVAVALCVPANIGTMLAGAIFGTWVGAGISMAGGFCSTVIAYGLARGVARKPVERLFGQHRLLRMLKEHDGILDLFRLRVIPIAPFAVLSYVVAIARGSLRNLLIATGLGGIASCVAYAFAGAALLDGIVSPSEASRRALWIAGGVTVAMLLLSLVAGLFRRKRS